MVNSITYKEFGKSLLTTLDLDPLYWLLAKTSWTDAMLLRFLLAYTVFYSASVAAYVAEKSNGNSKKFYNLLRYGNDQRWPRVCYHVHAR